MLVAKHQEARIGKGREGGEPKSKGGQTFYFNKSLSGK